MHDAKSADAKVPAENGEETVKERGRPAYNMPLSPPGITKREERTDFGQDEHDRLENDKDAIQNCPKRTAGLVGHGAVSVTARQKCA